MHYTKLIAMLLLAILITGCAKNSTIIQEQQRQIDDLKQQISNINVSQDSPEDPQVKLERCKLEADRKSSDAAMEWYYGQLGVEYPGNTDVIFEKLNEDTVRAKQIIDLRDGQIKNDYYKSFYEDCLSK